MYQAGMQITTRQLTKLCQWDSNLMSSNKKPTRQSGEFFSLPTGSSSLDPELIYNLASENS
jgi:hypothetical protein